MYKCPCGSTRVFGEFKQQRIQEEWGWDYIDDDDEPMSLECVECGDFTDSAGEWLT